MSWRWRTARRSREVSYGCLTAPANSPGRGHRLDRVVLGRWEILFPLEIDMYSRLHGLGRQSYPPPSLANPNQTLSPSVTALPPHRTRMLSPPTSCLAYRYAAPFLVYFVVPCRAVPCKVIVWDVALLCTARAGTIHGAGSGLAVVARQISDFPITKMLFSPFEKLVSSFVSFNSASNLAVAIISLHLHPLSDWLCCCRCC